jgi:hypothetical protein
VALLQAAVEQEPTVEAEYRYGGQQAGEELNLVADRELQGICESDLRQIPVTAFELVDALVALVSSRIRSNRSCVFCSAFLRAAETKLRPQSAPGK